MEVTELKKIDVKDLSSYILKHYGPMSHLKLQKLLYYCEAYHLAYFDDSLVDSEFEAWVHGPVCREIYDLMKGNSVLFKDIKYTESDDNPDPVFNSLISSQKQILGEILAELSTWKDIELEQATHQEAPWIVARKGYHEADRCNVEINKKLMMSFYKAELKLPNAIQ